MDYFNHQQQQADPQSSKIKSIFQKLRTAQTEFGLIPVSRIVSGLEKKFQQMKTTISQRKSVLPQLKLSIFHFQEQMQMQIGQLISIIDNILLQEPNSQYQPQFQDKININYLLEYKPLLKQFKEFAKISKDNFIQIKKLVKQFEGNCINYKMIETLEQNNTSNTILFNHLNDTFFQGIEENLKIWQFKNGQLYNSQLLKGHNQQISCLACSKNKNMIVSGGKDMQVRVWQTINKMNWQTTQILKGHTGQIHSIIINESDDEIISSSSDSSIIVWRLNSDLWQLIQNLEIHQNSVYQLSFNQSYSLFSSCSYDRNLIIWSLNNDQEWRKQQIIKHVTQSYRACFIQDNQIVLQQSSNRYIEIYTRNNNNVFVKTQTLEMQYLNTDISNFSPLQFIINKQLLLLRHNNKTIILRRKENWKFQIEEEIDGEAIGTLTNDENQNNYKFMNKCYNEYQLQRSIIFQQNSLFFKIQR
ncbi:unnamed protein product [Paramecium sonneborni]|uniref:WD40 repeat-containing protein n=1 Tax=Paramecium sonneborni TaxID=65129 RepID=A0A8S1KHF0_9CILI|nr:unnamed protein product [Paramecium sonneborni]